MTAAMVADFLVIGSGIAGLSYALEVAAHGKVMIITKKHSAESNTNYAQGGIAAVLTPDDSFNAHIEDTLTAGAGLCDKAMVEIVVKEGPDRVRELIELGARFSRRKSGSLHLGREGGHSTNRIVHAADATGREVEQALLYQVEQHPNITMLEYYFAVDLLLDEQAPNRCIGVSMVNEKTGEFAVLYAGQTLLATGGSGQLYAHTTNPPIATGDGLAMAARAGADVANMEFFQFHPTSLFHPDCRSFLISEAVRGEGGRLITKAGKHFMPDYHSLADLAPRDIVARAIDEQLKATGDECVYLDISHKAASEVLRHFPMIAETCRQYGIDITSEPIPVVPAAHYQCGGVVTNEYGESSIAGLYACGEVAYTGLHGANRLASNSLLEAMVLSYRAAQQAISRKTEALLPECIVMPTWLERQEGRGAPLADALRPLEQIQQQVQQIMWEEVGIIRSTARLEKAQQHLQEVWQGFIACYPQAKQNTPVHVETRNLIITAQIVVASAQCRHESRGLHQMVDYPATDPTQTAPTVLRFALEHWQ